MGIVRQHIRIANAARPELEEVDANAVVDSGAVDLCITKPVARQLRLGPAGKRIVTLANGSREEVDYVGPIRVEVFGRHAFTGAMVMGETVLLGAIPMEGMDVLIDPRRERLIPSPANPDIPGALAMGFGTSQA